MARRVRIAPGGLVCHVLSRANARAEIFHDSAASQPKNRGRYVESRGGAVAVGRMKVPLSGRFRAMPVSQARPSLRFHLPLIEPDVRICRIRLSEKVHAFACGRRGGSHFNWRRSNFSSSHGLQYQRGPETRVLCLRSHHRRNRYRTCELIFR